MFKAIRPGRDCDTPHMICEVTFQGYKWRYWFDVSGVDILYDNNGVHYLLARAAWVFDDEGVVGGVRSHNFH